MIDCPWPLRADPASATMPPCRCPPPDHPRVVSAPRAP